MKRASGVLMHISSLPGPFGIGCFGEEALQFAAFLRSAGCTYWQVLPFTQAGESASPYLSNSAYAGNELFIDPRQLRDLHLISDSDLEEARYFGSEFAVDFVWVKKNRRQLLEKAYIHISDEIRTQTSAFLGLNAWLDDVALYLTIREMQKDIPWWEWEDDGLRRHEKAIMDEIRSRFYDRYFFHCFVQYLFFSQWLTLKEQINQMGISMIGDIPIYVAADSADVWANAHLFQVNEDHTLSYISGVPPDYFSTDGQLWGNPLYQWEAHAKDGYSWWMQRLAITFQLYDMVRIDHFRGFFAYWSIPFGEKTAINGTWEIGPRMDLFRRLEALFPSAPIIAEDLGEIDDDVRDFLQDAGFPGMRVLEFGFQPYGDSTHLPHNYPANTVAYTGTHDNNTLFGWLVDATPEERSFALSYCHCHASDWSIGGPHSPVCRDMIRVVWQSHADLVMTPIQDLLGYGKDTRMNIPGKAMGNWSYRVTASDLSSIDIQWLLEMNRLYSRQLVGGRDRE